MAIPGSKPQFEIRAKVRIGEKKQKGGKEFPSSTDYFLSDDPFFQGVVGQEKPNALRIQFPHETAGDNFSSGLELWQGQMLLCYTKGEPAADPIAYRKRTIIPRGQKEPVSTILASDVARGAVMGNDRQPLTCRARECPLFKKKDGCKPMGRLVFFIDGDTTGSVWEVDTKSFNSVERIEAALSVASRRGDLRGRTFELSVHMERKGTSRFPLLSLKEVEVPTAIDTEADVNAVSAFQVIEKLTADGEEPRKILAAALDEYRPEWRTDQAYIDRIKEIGPEAALAALHGRLKVRLPVEAEA